MAPLVDTSKSVATPFRIRIGLGKLAFPWSSVRLIRSGTGEVIRECATWPLLTRENCTLFISRGCAPLKQVII